MTKQNGLAKAGELLPSLNTSLDTAPQPAVSRQLQKSLESLGRNIERRESDEVIQLPLWFEPERGTPNSFLRSALFAAIQGKTRTYLKEVILAGSRDITVKYTGEQLNQEDLTVWENLVHLARKHPLGTICHFTAHSFLKMLGLHTGGDEHARLHSTIIRMVACAVEIKHNGKWYVGSLIEDGAGNIDEPSPRYALRLNPTLIRLYGETQWTALDWQTRSQLRRKPLAQALHGYYSSHARPVPVKLATLREYTGSRNPQMASFKRQVREALDLLKTKEFLTDYRIDGDLVTVHRA
jgi:hypothetical protein